jgi:hypothetical protein
MKSVAELWEGIKQSLRQPFSALTIPADHTDQKKEEIDEEFEPDRHYFVVRINEMYLAAQRKWFSVIDPVVFVTSEFIYDKKEQTVPFIVGPGLLQKGQPVPQGMLFKDTRVAGILPYRGGRLTLSVVLCQMAVSNPVRQLLRVVERTASALDLSILLSSYVKVAGAVLDGFETLLGLEGTQPLIGMREELDPEGGDRFTPRFWALINQQDVDPQSLWVRDQELVRGKSLLGATPYRDADFVLYSLTRPPKNKRTDISTLSFYPLWERVEQEAGSGEKAYELAKADMASLYLTIKASPDLTVPQKEALVEDFKARMVAAQQGAKDIQSLGAGPAPELDRLREEALAILKM